MDDVHVCNIFADIWDADELIQALYNEMREVDEDAPVEHIVQPFGLTDGNLIRFLSITHWSPIYPRTPWKTAKNPNIINDPAASIRTWVKVFEPDLPQHGLFDMIPEKIKMFRHGERLKGDEPYRDSRFLDLYLDFSAQMVRIAVKKHGVEHLIVFGAHAREWIQGLDLKSEFPHVSLHVL